MKKLIKTQTASKTILLSKEFISVNERDDSNDYIMISIKDWSIFREAYRVLVDYFGEDKGISLYDRSGVINFQRNYFTCDKKVNGDWILMKLEPSVKIVGTDQNFDWDEFDLIEKVQK